MFEQVTVIGPGLLGSSLVLAIQERGLAKKVVIWARSEKTAEKTRKKLPVDRVEQDLENSVQGSDFVVICTPVETIAAILKKIAPIAEDDSIVTDVGSVKALICQEAKNLFKSISASFIGSHPMAGSEKSGMENADPKLFIKQPCIITPLASEEELGIDKLLNFWTELGMVTYRLGPKEHDQKMALFSHLPHLVSSILSHSISSHTEDARQLSGQGLRDTVRISGGDPNLWTGILSENKNNLLESLDKFEESLKVARSILTGQQRKSLCSFLEEAAQFKKSLKGYE